MHLIQVTSVSATAIPAATSLGQYLQGPRPPARVKRDGYGFTADAAAAWPFASHASALAKATIVNRHMGWGDRLAIIDAPPSSNASSASQPSTPLHPAVTITQLKTLRHYNLNPVDFEALLTLAQQGDLDMTPLASELGICTATATLVANRLVKGGYIKRTCRDSDRRSVAVALQELGRQRIDQITGRYPQTLATA